MPARFLWQNLSMSIREITVAELESSKVGAEAAEQTFHMDEQTFRVFYENTARPLWAYLSRILGSTTLADDLVQDSYYRFLRATLKSDDAAYQKAYLFRIATNLARDHWRRLPRQEQGQPNFEEATTDDRTAERVQQQSDLQRALGGLKPRERELLWLAYVEGASHKEIAGVLGLRAASVRLLLFRARHKVRQILRRPRLGMKTQSDVNDRF
jgi:RNA polymerase sigma-70 factor (ECF subfamily)